ncbi:hypothetical protein G6011_01951 [Alternaria panax]|uniref:Heterokaryon incompatibility domain-containing protein n=1 Tax=Alternaria panax TaxID=48097 RepID=A0AAD4FFK1_9PLEO|nr:hypothetical protein G6011_01951 [Alternaria panax]
MPYQYQPLPVLHDSEDVYIRLLELHRGPPSGPITGRLYSTLLSKAPTFYAVSYCWGPLAHKGTIHITNAAPPRDLENDNTLEIPATLIPLLYQMRGWRLLKARTLWIDSVCFNQMDNDEKTANVPKMREVYMKAALTVSWLGLEVKGIAAAFDYASRLHTTWRREMAEQGQIILTAEEEKEEDVRVQVKVGDPALEALLHLLDRPYFERAWIMQEIVVSSRVWCMCGSAMISWSSLLAAYLYLMATQLWVFEFYHGIRLHNILVMKLSEMEWARGADVDWSGTLLKHRMCLSGDPRDKVYAFYGMRCKKALNMLGIKPDYDEATTTEVMYTRLAARALHKAQVAVLHVPRLTIIPHEGSDPNVERLAIPSWVPDWRWTEATPMSLLLTEAGEAALPDYRASKDSVFKPSFDLEAYNSPSTPEEDLKQLPKRLQLYGVTVAKITQLTPRRWIAQKASRRQPLLDQAKLLQFNMHQIYEWEMLLFAQHTTQVYPATGEPARQAVYQMFMAGETQHTPEVRLSASAAFERRQRILRLFHTFHIHSFLICYIVVVLIERVFRCFGWVNPEAQFRSMVGCMLNRKGAWMVDVKDSKMAYHGLVPSICRHGDHVVLAGGVTTPLILRRKVEGTDTTWEFIGDAYVHGIMKGELWEKRKGDRENMWIT